jgi:hypothetical protein
MAALTTTNKQDPTTNPLEPVNQPTLQDIIGEAQKLGRQQLEAQRDILREDVGDVGKSLVRRIAGQNIGFESGIGKDIVGRAISEQAKRLEPYAADIAASTGLRALDIQEQRAGEERGELRAIAGEERGELRAIAGEERGEARDIRTLERATVAQKEAEARLEERGIRAEDRDYGRLLETETRSIEAQKDFEVRSELRTVSSEQRAITAQKEAEARLEAQGIRAEDRDYAKLLETETRAITAQKDFEVREEQRSIGASQVAYDRLIETEKRGVANQIAAEERIEQSRIDSMELPDLEQVTASAKAKLASQGMKETDTDYKKSLAKEERNLKIQITAQQRLDQRSIDAEKRLEDQGIRAEDRDYAKLLETETRQMQQNEENLKLQLALDGKITGKDALKSILTNYGLDADDISIPNFRDDLIDTWFADQLENDDKYNIDELNIILEKYDKILGLKSEKVTAEDIKELKSKPEVVELQERVELARQGISPARIDFIQAEKKQILEDAKTMSKVDLANKWGAQKLYDYKIGWK